MPTVPVWMTRQEMSDTFNVFGCDIRRVIRIIYKNMEFDVYSLEMVIAIAFRLRTKECMDFRRFIIGRLNTNHESKPINLFFSLSPYNGRRVNN